MSPRLLHAALAGVILLAWPMGAIVNGGEPTPMASGTPGKRLLWRGVCCFYNSAANELFLQDPSEGILVRPTTLVAFELGAGQLLEIEGDAVTERGRTEVRAHSIRLLGEGPLPAPVESTYDQLAAGEFDCRYVQFAGVVRAVAHTRADAMLPLRIAGKQGQVTVLVKEHHREDCREMIDAEVRISGVGWREFDGAGNYLRTTLRVSGMGDIEILKSAPAASLPNWDPSTLSQSQPGPVSSHRVSVQATVWAPQGGAWFGIANGTRAIRFETVEPALLRRGEKIDIRGFPSLDANGILTLEDAVCRKLGDLEFHFAPAAGLQNGHLIRLEASTVSAWDSAGKHLRLRSGDALLSARLDSPSPKIARLRPGSRVQVSGIAMKKITSPVAAEGFELLVGASDDIEILKSARGWPIGTTMAVVCLLFILSVCWQRARIKMGHRPT